MPEVVESPGKPAKAKGPLPPAPTVAPPVREDQEITLRRQSRQERVDTFAEPIEARVVYLGTNPRKTVVYPLVTDVVQDEAGQDIHLTPPDDPEQKTLETYVFERFDTRRRPIRERLTSDGKVWVMCRNIRHLARFYEELDAEESPVFEIRAPQRIINRIVDFIERRNRAAAAETESGPTLVKEMAGAFAKAGVAEPA
jgi:hypothetical protein